MRPSSRERIIDAVLSIAARSGVPGITMETVAIESDLSKGGVQYHFASKEEMMQAVVDEVTQRFERAATAYLGGPREQATLTRRLEAFVRCSMSGLPGPGELAIFLHDAHSSGGGDSWNAFVERWTSAPEETLNDAQRVMLLAVDGLWLADASGGASTNQDDRARIADFIVATITAPHPHGLLQAPRGRARLCPDGEV